MKLNNYSINVFNITYYIYYNIVVFLYNYIYFYNFVIYMFNTENNKNSY